MCFKFAFSFNLRRYPVAHFCPYCDGSVLEHNCGAVQECHSRPDLMQFLSDDYVGRV